MDLQTPFRPLLAATLALVVSTAAPVRAEGDLLDTIATLDIVPGWTTDSGTRMAAFRVRLAPGWKTYWRAPGDAGIPPMLDLAGSVNVAGVALSWPVPDVFETAGMRSIGYYDQVVLPVEITARGPGEMRLTGTLDIGVCDEICVPVRLSFDAAIPQGGARDGQIVAALIDRPLTAAEAGVGGVTCTLAPTARGMAITVRAQVPPLGAGEEVVIEAGNAEVWVSEPAVRRSGDVIEAQAQMVHVTGGAFSVDRSAVRITVLAAGRGIDIRGCSAG